MRKVIYTAICGSYDQLKLPTQVTEGWDYVCFTDQPDITSDLWKIRQIDSKAFGTTKTARYVKINNELFLDYDLSIWIDGNFEIRCDLDAFVDAFHKGNFSLMSHGRSCTYHEAQACITYNKDGADTIRGQMSGYRSEGFPENFGMVATGLIIRDHGHKEIVNFTQKWWEQVRTCSKRDQLSFNYTLWKNPIDVNVMDFDNIVTNYFDWQNHTHQ